MAWQALELAEANGVKPSAITTNALIGAVVHSNTMPLQEKLELVLKLVEKLHAAGLQVRISCTPY